LANRSNILNCIKEDKVVKIKSILRYLAAATLIAALAVTPAYASVTAEPSALNNSVSDYVAIKDMGFEATSVYPLYVDNSTNENPDDKWVEIKDSKNVTLLRIDKSELHLDEGTSLLTVSKAYYESAIKPLIEKAKSSDEYIAINEMGFEGSGVKPVFVNNATEQKPNDNWVEIRNDKNMTMLKFDMAKTYEDSNTGLLMVLKSYYESDIKPIVENPAYIAIREMGFEGAKVKPVFVDNSTDENPEAKWVEIRSETGWTLLKLDKSKTYEDTQTGLLMVLKSYYESDIRPLIESAK
jgi:hypothetical protein